MPEFECDDDLLYECPSCGCYVDYSPCPVCGYPFDEFDPNNY